MPRPSARSAALFSATLLPGALVCAFLAAQAPTAQAPATQAPATKNQASQPGGPHPTPTNLKVLPKGTTGDQVDALMRQYNGDLGVECSFCHAQNPTTHEDDYPSDGNPEKEQARYMMYMTADLNEKYLNDMPDRRYADPITCGTCHRGKDHPSVFVPATK